MARDGSSTGFKFDDAHAPTCGKNPFSLHNSGWITAGGVLASEYDAAQVQWGGRWRMPTVQELKDLRAKCDWMWSTMNGVNGYVIRGRGAYFSTSIFLPASGDGYATSLNHAGSEGYYWSSVPDSGDNASWCLYFFSNDECNIDLNYRSYGLSVRPVQGLTK